MDNDKNEETLVEMNLYTEIETSRIYEGKLFETFVIMRPILPQFHNDIKQYSLEEFGQKFDDFCGNREEVRAFLRSYNIPNNHPLYITEETAVVH